MTGWPIVFLNQKKALPKHFKKLASRIWWCHALWGTAWILRGSLLFAGVAKVWLFKEWKIRMPCPRGLLDRFNDDSICSETALNRKGHLAKSNFNKTLSFASRSLLRSCSFQDVKQVGHDTSDDKSCVTVEAQLRMAQSIANMAARRIKMHTAARSRQNQVRNGALSCVHRVDTRPAEWADD